MPTGVIPFIIQPVNREGMAVERFVQRLMPPERTAFKDLIRIAGPDFWKGRSLIAVGTPTFPDSFYEETQKDNETAGDHRFDPLITRKGNDIDLVLMLDGAPTPNDIHWHRHLRRKLQDAGIEVERQYGHENGGFMFYNTVELRAGQLRNIDLTTTEIDTQPYRHKFYALGDVLRMRFKDSRDFQIRRNYAGRAENIITLEQEVKFCHSVLFRNGATEEFVRFL